jgi:2,6-dihydroxypseudooxynicotine hydrolase
MMVLADKAREAVDGAFRQMNEVWAQDGPNGFARLYALPYFRAEMIGLDHTEVARILAKVRTFFDAGRNGDWIETWSAAGSEYRERAQLAESDGHEATAGDLYLAATACYFVAGYVIHAFEPIEPREHAHRQSIDCYRRGARYFEHPAEEFRFASEGVTIRGYLRTPAPGPHPWPCVILVGGANSTKEENHATANYFLRREMAVLTFDGPGQGEYLQDFARPMRREAFDRAISGAVDALMADSRIEAGSIGLWGKASGTIPALHACSVDHRIKALALHPGTYRWIDFYDAFPILPQKLEMATFLGARSFDELARLILFEMTVEGAVGDVSCPILAVSSERDIIPADQGERLRAEAGGDVTLVVLPGQVHGGPPTIALPLEADWMRDQLAGATER